MNEKDLYEEEDLEEQGEDEDEEEIIDNSDDGLEEEAMLSQKDSENKKTSPQFKTPQKQEEQINKNDIPPNQNQTNQTNSNEEKKEDILNYLLNNPAYIENNAKEEDQNENINDEEEEIQINFHSEDYQKGNNINKTIPEVDEYDFDAALAKVIAKMAKDDDLQNNNDLYDVLFSDKELLEKELNKCNISKKVDLSAKMNQFLEKKEKKRKQLEEKLNDEFNKQCTFAPVVNTNIKNNPNISQISAKRRNINEFIKDQQNYQKKIQTKITNLKDSEDKKAIQELKKKPQISQASKKLAQEKYKGEEVYRRLYNQKEKQKQIFEREPKKSISKTTNVNNEEKFKELYNEAMKRQEKFKEKLNEKDKRIKESVEYKANSSSNKFLIKKFKTQFKEQIEQIMISSKESTKFSIEQFQNLYIKLRFISSPIPTEKELKLLNEIIENIQDKENQMKLDHIFIFSLSILNLFEYYIITNYQNLENANRKTEASEVSSQKNITNLKKSKSMIKNYSVNNVLSQNQSQVDTNFINKINNDLNSRIVTLKKYGGFDKDGNLIITISQSKLISKAFSLFSQNYNNRPLTHQPLTNTPSKKTINNTNNSNYNSKSSYISTSVVVKAHEPPKNNQRIINSNSMNRIEQLYLESAKKKNFIEKESEKYHREKEEKELENCTFKPQINSSSNYNTNIIPVENSKSAKEQRIEMLYKKGTELQLNKKNKTTNEIDAERYKNDLTFKPETHAIDYTIFQKEKSIYQDDDLMKFHQRLKKGRDEKEYKESIFERGEFLLRPRNQSENKILRTKGQISNGAMSVNNSIISNSKKSFLESDNNNKKRSFIESMNNNNLFTPIKNVVKRNPNERPVLEIDVNLKNGIKKKILVYDGDKAEDLAGAFAEENSKNIIYKYILDLDSKMRKKLKNLVQQEIDKLLMRIAEESVTSFKSN